MSQNDFNIDNQSAPTFRSDLNSALQALASLSSGSSEPSVTYANMLWYDALNNILKIRNEVDDGWISLFSLSQSTNSASAFGSSTFLGQIFAIWDDIAGTPDNSGTAKFVRLTAGQSGVGGFNEGLLTAESVSGSAPLVTATADVAVGPMAGQFVPLLNTEGSFVRPGTSNRILQFDQMQRITGYFAANRFFSDTPATAGALSRGSSGGRPQASDTVGANNLAIDFNSATSPNARASGSTNGETRPKNRQATYYMRIV